MKLEEPCLPFLKWAGGKRWLVRNDVQVAPTHFNTYIEPFLGSGAIFFSLKPSQSILADINSELVNSYNSLKTNWKDVEAHLRRHGKGYDDRFFSRILDAKDGFWQEKLTSL